MTLYDSIIGYKRSELVNIFLETAKYDNSLTITLLSSAPSTLRTSLMKSHAILDTAYELNGDAPSVGNIAVLLSHFKLIDGPSYELYEKNKDLVDLRRGWIHAQLILYQDIVRQEGSADNYVDAVRWQYLSKDKYKARLCLLEIAEDGLQNRLKEVVPSSASLITATHEASKIVRNKSLDTLFPSGDCA